MELHLEYQKCRTLNVVAVGPAKNNCASHVRWNFPNSFLATLLVVEEPRTPTIFKSHGIIIVFLIFSI